MVNILHFSDYLPDHRVEKYAIYHQKKGFNIHFLGYDGPTELLSFKETSFSTITTLNISKQERFFPKIMKNKDELKSIINNIDPDIIHVHNIFNLNIIIQLFPDLIDRLVYDSHEYWSKQVKLRFRLRLNSKLFHRILVPIWERNIQKVPTITVTPQIATEYAKMYDADVITIPNLPLGSLIPNLNTLRNEKTIAYLGKLEEDNLVYSYRDNSPLINTLSNYNEYIINIYGNNYYPIDLPNLNYKGFVFHQNLLTSLNSNVYGLYGFQAHPFHYYTSPVRISNFIHSGLIPIIPNSMSMGFFNQFSKYSIIYDDIRKIPKLLEKFEKSYSNDIHESIIKLAQDKFVLEKYLKPLDKVYQNIIENH